MKLLSWMHRKLQKDNTGSFNGSAVGNSFMSLKPPLNNQDDYVRPGNNSKLKCQHYLKELKVVDTIDINNEESAEIFPGFLTIGTLNMESVTDPPTPTFDLTRQKANEDGIEDMKYDLKLITEELEKFLRDEAEKAENNEPSGRNSQASDVTLIDKIKEEVDDCKCIDTQEYPLQGYLLASLTELKEIRPKERKERTSLQELFQSSLIIDKSSSIEAEKTKKKAKKKLKSSTCVMNKMLQTPRPSLKNSAVSTGHAVESFPIMTKLSKIKRLFHKKIHPEISTTEKDPNKYSKNETSNILLTRPSHSYTTSALDHESTRMGCWGTLMKGETRQSNADTKLPRHGSSKKKVNTPDDLNGSASKEHWINTDADYLVLELQKNEEVPY